MNDLERLASDIARARISQGLSQQTLAQKTGVKQSQISELETAKRNLRVATLTQIARGVGLELLLIPRALLPAVNYVVNGQTVDVPAQTSKYETWEEDD
jgi:transcriptional regulator with XRE-family HTH domain